VQRLGCGVRLGHSSHNDKVGRAPRWTLVWPDAGRAWWPEHTHTRGQPRKTQLLAQIEFLTTLETLDLTNNTIHSVLAAVGWVNLRSLSVLKLRNTSIPTATFPPLDSCANLQFLDLLSYNAFSGPVPPAAL
jgi:hypothetical protein